MPNGIPDDQTEFPQPPQSLVSQFFATSDNGDSSGAAGSASAAPAPQGACGPERSRWAHPAAHNFATDALTLPQAVAFMH